MYYLINRQNNTVVYESTTAPEYEDVSKHWRDGISSIYDPDQSMIMSITPIIVPEQVTVVQLKLALLQLGYLDAVEADLPALGRSAQIKWGDSRRPVRRHDELVIAMRDIRLWTDNIVDEIFILASAL